MKRTIGTFSEIACLIRSFTQLFYNNARNTDNPYWQWILQIRCFLRYILMPKIAHSQVRKIIELTYKISYEHLFNISHIKLFLGNNLALKIAKS